MMRVWGGCGVDKIILGMDMGNERVWPFLPNGIVNITTTFRALGRLKWPSEYEDYHVGIPFGTFLTVGGFINFMLTGSTSALRFGIVLGLALLAVGISSLRSQREDGSRPRLLVKGQAGCRVPWVSCISF